MCGIFCTVIKSDKCTNTENIKDRCSDFHECPCDKIKANLTRRGPDKIQEIDLNLTEDWRGRFAGSVLWTQGTQPVGQPVEDENGNLLLWNGDVLYGSTETESACDSEVVFERLKTDPLSTIVEIGGPYAFVFWHAKRRQLWFGRDVLGRVSLLWQISPHLVTLASVAHKLTIFTEVPALGIYMLDLTETQQVEIQFFPWAHLSADFSSLSDVQVVTREKIVHSTLGDGDSRLSWLDVEPATDDLSIYDLQNTFAYLLKDAKTSCRVEKLLAVLTASVECRVKKQPEICKKCVHSDGKRAMKCDHCCVAVLFSGGLDSTILALLAHKFVPENKPIDLYNVAFQQQNGSFEVPDRVTGHASLEELKALAPRRLWNLIEVDVSREQLDTERSQRVADLLHPLTSVLDDSLGCALWFAARGEGNLNGLMYKSPARVVLMGMGADEQLGGYTRHRNTLRHSRQWATLGRELAADTDNIARRNLGRDNRVTCDHGRQPRAPFLDERVVAYVNTLPPWHRYGKKANISIPRPEGLKILADISVARPGRVKMCTMLGMWDNLKRCMPISSWPPGKGDKLLLRLLAHRLGLSNAATLPKRALQFGSRIANSREKADQVSDRL